MTIQFFKQALAVSAALLMSAAHAQSESQDATGAQTRSSAQEAATEFPDPGRAWQKGGAAVDPQSVRQVAPGMDKDHVYALIREPHFSEGVFHVRVWNYIFQIEPESGGQPLACQYQVRFGDDMKVSSTHWRDASCARLVDPQEAAAGVVVGGGEGVALTIEP